jgi:tetratricopeptide (TPR) repeat protein
MIFRLTLYLAGVRLESPMEQRRHTQGLLLAFGLLLAGVSGRGAQGLPQDPSKALERGDYKSAETYYRNLLSESPHSPEVLSNLGVTLQMQGKSSEAIHVFERALKLKPMPRTYALLAEERCMTRDLDAARPMVAQTFRDDLQNPSIMVLIAPCFLELDEPIESVQVYQGLVSYSAFPTDLALIQLSRSYLRAAQFFIGRLAKAPNNSAYISAIQQARNTGSRDARSAFGEAAKASPNFSSDLDFMDAVSRWRDYPQDAALLYLLSVLSSEQSMRQVEICDDEYPESPYLTQLKAEMFADQGHEEEAINQYDKLMQAHLELPDLFFDLGMLFRKEREWEKALDAFHKQLSKDPNDERTAARISEALIQVGRWSELSDFLATRVKTSNPPLWALLDLSEASQNLEKPDRAIATLLTAEQAYPSDASIHYRLMRLYRQTGNLAEAQKELKLFHAASK